MERTILIKKIMLLLALLQTCNTIGAMENQDEAEIISLIDAWYTVPHCNKNQNNNQTSNPAHVYIPIKSDPVVLEQSVKIEEYFSEEEDEKVAFTEEEFENSPLNQHFVSKKRKRSVPIIDRQSKAIEDLHNPLTNTIPLCVCKPTIDTLKNHVKDEAHDLVISVDKRLWWTQSFRPRPAPSWKQPLCIHSIWQKCREKLLKYDQ
jgi:hypothetical protein